MSKIITKKDLDLVVESTLIEAGLVKEDKNTKPDYLDLDGDGDKEESMKKAADEKEEMEETDIVTESVKELVNEVNNTTLNEELSEELDNFKRFINFKY